MPLPQQVIDQLSRDPAKTPGWSSGVLLFSAGLFAMTLVIYFALILGYEPYLQSAGNGVQDKIATLAQSVSSGDQGKIVTFYSEVANLRTLLANHVLFSQFLDWLEKNTDANVYYSQFSFASGNQVALTGNAKTEADVSQQVAIFEASPSVKSVTVSNATLSGSTGQWNFAITLTMDPSIFLSPVVATPAASVSASSTQ